MQTATSELERCKSRLHETEVRERSARASLKRTVENQKKEIELLKHDRPSRVPLLRSYQQEEPRLQKRKPSVAAPNKNPAARSGSRKENAGVASRNGAGVERRNSRSRSRSKGVSRQNSAEKPAKSGRNPSKRSELRYV